MIFFFAFLTSYAISSAILIFITTPAPIPFYAISIVLSTSAVMRASKEERQEGIFCCSSYDSDKYLFQILELFSKPPKLIAFCLQLLYNLRQLVIKFIFAARVST